MGKTKTPGSGLSITPNADISSFHIIVFTVLFRPPLYCSNPKRPGTIRQNLPSSFTHFKAH